MGNTVPMLKQCAFPNIHIPLFIIYCCGYPHQYLKFLLVLLTTYPYISIVA